MYCQITMVRDHSGQVHYGRPTEEILLEELYIECIHGQFKFDNEFFLT